MPPACWVRAEGFAANGTNGTWVCNLRAAGLPLALATRHFRSLRIGGHLAPEARWPDAEPGFPWSSGWLFVEAATYFDTHPPSWVVMLDRARTARHGALPAWLTDASGATNWTMAKVKVVPKFGWNDYEATVAPASGMALTVAKAAVNSPGLSEARDDAIYLTITCPDSADSKCDGYDTKLDAGARLYVYGVRDALSAGEWFHDGVGRLRCAAAADTAARAPARGCRADDNGPRARCRRAGRGAPASDDDFASAIAFEGLRRRRTTRTMVSRTGSACGRRVRACRPTPRSRSRARAVHVELLVRVAQRRGVRDEWLSCMHGRGLELHAARWAQSYFWQRDDAAAGCTVARNDNDRWHDPRERRASSARRARRRSSAQRYRRLAALGHRAARRRRRSGRQPREHCRAQPAARPWRRHARLLRSRLSPTRARRTRAPSSRTIACATRAASSPSRTARSPTAPRATRFISTTRQVATACMATCSMARPRPPSSCTSGAATRLRATCSRTRPTPTATVRRVCRSRGASEDSEQHVPPQHRRGGAHAHALARCEHGHLPRGTRPEAVTENVYFPVATTSATTVTASDGSHAPPAWWVAERGFTPIGNFSAWRAAGYDVGSIVADPLFIDAQASNFCLAGASPAYALGFGPFGRDLQLLTRGEVRVCGRTGDDGDFGSRQNPNPQIPNQ